MKNKSVKIIASSILFVAVVLIIGYFIGLPIVEKIAKQKAISSLQDQIGAQVDLDSVEIKPFQQKVILHKLRITNPYNPINNILAFEQADLNFRLKEYWDHKTVYMNNGVMSGTSVDLAKRSGKKGWVDTKRYPKKDGESLKSRIEDIDLKKIKKDFKKNFVSDLKKTQVYKNYEKTYVDLKSKLDSKGEYRSQLKSLEADFKALSKTKVDKDNLAQTLAKAQGMKEKFDLMKVEFSKLKELRSSFTHQGNLLNKAQAQVISSFLNRQGFGDLNSMLQEKVQSLFHNRNKVNDNMNKDQEKAQALGADEEHKYKKSHKRDDVLFYINKFLIKGDQQNIKGEISKFHNKNGEDFKKWIGSLELEGELKAHGRLEASATRLSSSDKAWDIEAQLKNFSLDSYDFLSFAKVSQGQINLKLSSLFGDITNLKALVDINLKKIKTDNAWLGSLVQVPLKLLIKGSSSNTSREKMSFTTRILTKLPSLVHPLKSELSNELRSMASLEKNKMTHQVLDLPELSNYRAQIDKLTSRWKKQGLNKLFKGLFKKL